MRPVCADEEVALDTDKGDRIRSRLCDMEFRQKWESTAFAGTPPLQSLRCLALQLLGELEGHWLRPLGVHQCLLLLLIRWLPSLDFHQRMLPLGRVTGRGIGGAVGDAGSDGWRHRGSLL